MTPPDAHSPEDVPPPGDPTPSGTPEPPGSTPRGAESAPTGDPRQKKKRRRRGKPPAPRGQSARRARETAPRPRSEPVGKPSPRRDRRRDDAEPPRLGERAPGIYRGIARWIEERLVEEFGDDLPPPTVRGGDDAIPTELELTIRFPFARDPRRWRRAERSFRSALENQLDALCDQLRTDRLGYRDGHVFCPWCASPICEHSTPPDPRAILQGFHPTGVPLWRDLGSWLLERGDERVDRFYGDRPLPLAVRIDGEELTADILPEFAESMRPLDIAGAVVTGNFAIPTPRGGETMVAITALALERRTSSGAPRYSVNLVANLPPPHHLATLLAERVVPILSDWVANLRLEIARVHDRWLEERRGGKRLSVGECRALVDRALENAVLYLEKRLRRRQARTDHAEARAEDPERPTATALSDALSASGESIFHDRKERTVIVRGPRNRVHVFRADGTHITSIQYTGDAIRDRVATGRWVPLERARVEALRQGIVDRRRIGDGGRGSAGHES